MSDLDAELRIMAETQRHYIQTGEEFSWSRRELIIGSLGDLFLDFFFHDRQQLDSSLALGEIEAAVASGEVAFSELVELCAIYLQRNLLGTS